MRNLGLRLAFLATVLSSPLAAQSVQSKHAQIELLSQQSSVGPGPDLLFGVHFLLEPGWHIYWVNPGDSGQPPVLQWQLPAGFSAGEIEWPRPERMQSMLQLADFGYHNEVLLMVPVHAPAFISNTQPAGLPFAVDVKWLICREICLPDHAQLHLSLPLATTSVPDPAHAAMFAGAQKLLPKPFPRGWKASAESLKDHFVLSVRTGKPIAKAEFFPLDAAQVENAAPQKLEPSAGGLKITLKKSDLLLKPVAALRGVLVLSGGDAYRVEAPVTAAKGIK
ncbi:MAG TPA: protein-disulfide reductase DsbD domain-containing protein [Candidatus Angelobacter sp.]